MANKEAGVTSSTNVGSLKRKFSNSEEECNNKREGEPSLSILNLDIPSISKDWDDQLLLNLHVEVVPGVFTPYVVFSSYPDFLENQKNKRSELIAMMNDALSERKILLDCYNHAMENIINLDYEHIDHVPVYRVKELYENTKTLNKLAWRDWKKQLTESDFKTIRGLKEKCRRLQQKVNDFLWQLLYIVDRRQLPEPEELSEGMFQELFMRFARIFELGLVGAPNVGCYTFKVNGKEISSVPDALVINPCKKNSLLAVVKVTKTYKKEIDLEAQKKMRKVIKVQNPTEHVDTNLKCQHIGDILSVLRCSLFGPTGMFGFVVQATEVTVVAFATDKNYIQYIKTGLFPEQDCATVKYSEKCNILSKKGRHKLVKTFLDMATLMKYM
ncbi:uncharacterized protein LOC133205653 [Saccostrea echinata]|uniref:uncharacterized protein LOC133205653 n=1 Tax=Saccostrea echinata TaxID=191078 RepID=UPI002A818CEE|nr:uncharacterized protein LOC133205653 [Saccostrea echinata]